jgi:hypothetical protein
MPQTREALSGKMDWDKRKRFTGAPVNPVPASSPRPVAFLLFCAVFSMTGCLLAHPAWAARRLSVDETKFLSELDAATLGLENEFTQPLPKAEATLHGALTLQYVLPIDGSTQFATMMFQGDALLRDGRYGVVLTPRLRIDSFASPVGSTSIFLQQAYAFVRFPTGEVKVGKVLGQLGRLWDFGLYGPVITNYDYKMTPDIGISVEGQLDGVKQRKFSYALQYFAVDGRTFSVSNPRLLAIDRARRVNNVTVRVVPQVQLGDVHLAWGLSGQTYRTRLEHVHQVWRAATDIGVTWRNLGGFVEIGRQAQPDLSAANNMTVPPLNYVWSGIQGAFGPISLRYHVNAVRYEAPKKGWGILQQPGIEYRVAPMASVVLEGGVWRSTQALPDTAEENLFLFAMLRY